MQSDWEIVHFNFTPYKDTDLSILAAPDDVQVLIDDHVVKTATMRGSPFIAPFETEVKEWELRLVRRLIYLNRAFDILCFGNFI